MGNAIMCTNVVHMRGIQWRALGGEGDDAVLANDDPNVLSIRAQYERGMPKSFSPT